MPKLIMTQTEFDNLLNPIVEEAANRIGCLAIQQLRTILNIPTNIQPSLGNPCFAALTADQYSAHVLYPSVGPALSTVMRDASSTHERNYSSSAIALRSSLQVFISEFYKALGIEVEIAQTTDDQQPI